MLTEGLALTLNELKRQHPEAFEAFTNALLEHYRISTDVLVDGLPDEVLVSKGRCSAIKQLWLATRTCAEDAAKIIHVTERKRHGRQPSTPAQWINPA